MILYHGSYAEISEPDLSHSRANVDFGKGFYTTTIHEQAEKAAKKPNPVVDTAAYDTLNVLRFDSYSEEWLDFILSCRSGNDSTAYDIVIGGVANDKVFNTVELYLDGLINKEEAIRRLKYEKPNLQICFRTEKAIACLHFKGSEKL